MSSHHNTSRSSPDSTPTSTSSSIPPTARPSEASSATRQSTWASSPYDPFAGLPQQDRPRVYPESRYSMSMPAPEQQIPDARLAATWQGLGLSPQQEEGTLSMSPNPYHHGDLPQSFAREDSPIHVRQSSQEMSTSARRSLSISGYGSEMRTQALVEQSPGSQRPPSRRRPYNQDEFDGPSQLIPPQHGQQEQMRAQALPQLPTHLSLDEQDDIFRQANDILAQCAFYFVARYQFPIPVERDKPQVRLPSDREWAEWAYLLKRLATKRRIPARFLFENQIKNLVTTLENSISVRQAASGTPRSTSQTTASRISRDDRYVLQMISSGIQVARILKDSLAMSQLDDLYKRTEIVILERRNRPAATAFSY